MSIKKERVPLQISNGVIIVPIRYEVTQALLENLKEDLRSYIPENRASAAVFDLKGVDILDGEEFDSLVGIMTMLQLMGMRTVLCGLSPGVVAAIVELRTNTRNLEVALDLNAAFGKLNKA